MDLPLATVVRGLFTGGSFRLVPLFLPSITPPGVGRATHPHSQHRRSRVET